MKLLKQTIAIILFLVAPYLIQGQNEDSKHAFWIHEDRVKPSMTDTYEKIMKDLIAACKENNVQETQWLTLRFNDNTYLYVTPMKNMAELDKNGFQTLNDKMGDDKVGKLFSRFDETYDEHGDYVVYLNDELSYMPDGMTQTIEGQNYRIMYYNYVTPEKDKGFAESMKKIKAAFEKHNSKIHYRVYKTGFGVMGTYYMIAVAGESEAKLAAAGDENRSLMKDDFEPLIKELNNHAYKKEEKRGWMRPDLGYAPAK